uniref:Uncharacterized protein n=1 Tax=Pithovirus LCPAC404 TaxID=2506597 RepID=A0A481ZFU1_9VIRU|nr:MAG: uncharacterized protein LCPAC404_00150 [Pithovirus LCPAC404]
MNIEQKNDDQSTKWLDIIQKVYNTADPLFNSFECKYENKDNFYTFLDAVCKQGIAIENIMFANRWKDESDSGTISRDSFCFTVPLSYGEEIACTLRKESVIYFVTYSGTRYINWKAFGNIAYGSSLPNECSTTKMFLSDDANIFSVGIPTVLSSNPVRKIAMYRGPLVAIEIESDLSKDLDSLSRFIPLDFSYESLIPNNAILFTLMNTNRYKKIMKNLDDNTIRFDLVSTDWPQNESVPDNIGSMNTFHAMINILNNASSVFNFTLEEEARVEWRAIETTILRLSGYTVDELRRMIIALKENPIQTHKNNLIQQYLSLKNNNRNAEWCCECSNEQDPFSLDNLNTFKEEEVIRVFLGKPDRGEGYVINNLLKYFLNVETTMKNWVQYNDDIPIAPTGRGGNPGNETYYKLPLSGSWINSDVVRWLNIIMENPELPRRLNLVIMKEKQLIGNSYGSFGMSAMHGQSPGVTIWGLPEI